MSGGWSGGNANYTWHRGRQRDGSEIKDIRRVLAEFANAKAGSPA